MALYPLSPSGRVTERRGWRTDVLRTPGHEQRVAVRALPRVVITAREDLREWELDLRLTTLRALLGAESQIPIWRDACAIAASGTWVTSVAADTSQVRWPTGSATEGVVIASSASTYAQELRTLATAAAGTVSWSGSVLLPSSGLAWLVPARTALLEDVSVQRKPYGLHELTTRWHLRPGTDDAPPGSSALLGSYSAEPVLMSRARGDGWREGLERELERLGGEGYWTWASAHNAPTRRLEWTWVARSRAEVAALLRMLAELRGRQSPVWVSTWGDDWGDAGTSLLVPSGAGFRSADSTELWAAWSGRGGATWHVGFATGVGGAGGVGDLALATSITGAARAAPFIGWTCAVTPSAGTRPSRLYRCRLDTDDVTLEHDETGTTVRLPFVEIP